MIRSNNKDIQTAKDATAPNLEIMATASKKPAINHRTESSITAEYLTRVYPHHPELVALVVVALGLGSA